MDTMEARQFRIEEMIGLAIAVVLHTGLIVFLVTRPPPVPEKPKEERVVVSLASAISLESTSPQPAPDSQAATAPSFSDIPMPMPAMEEDFSEPETVSQPEPEIEPIPQPMPQEKAKPKPKPQAKPKPKPKSQAKPKPKPKQARAKPKPQAKPKPKPKSSSPKNSSSKGGSQKFADAFKNGTGGGSSASKKGSSGAKFGPQQQAALRSAITRELRPHWKVPQGPEAEKLVTILRWRLNKDGSLEGNPVMVRQTGVNDTNRAQAKLHAERAIRAVRLAAPFKLPPEYYSKWSTIREWRFDRRL